MNPARRINRIEEHSTPVVLRDGRSAHEIELWRGDHFTFTAHPRPNLPVVQRYLVLDFGIEERFHPITEDDPTQPGAQRPVLDSDGNPTHRYLPTGLIQIEMQRVTDDGEGMSIPTTRMIDNRPAARDVALGWHGWVHIPDSPRRPSPDEAVAEPHESPGVTVEYAQHLAEAMIACYRERNEHVGLSVNFGDRRCYVCDLPWPCEPAFMAEELDNVADVDPESLNGTVFHHEPPTDEHASLCGLPYGLPADGITHRQATETNPVDCPACIRLSDAESVGGEGSASS